MHLDTIVAPATAPGAAGIAVIRLSGPGAITAASAVFDRRLRNRRVVLGNIREPATGEVVDEAIGILMRGPRSFTREDVVELHCHGGSVVTARVMGLLLAQGVRTAEPGEFTLRAFLNGRLDLAQAEAVLDVINARTGAAQRVAMEGLRGRLSAAVDEIRSALLSALAYLVARIDFPDEDVPEEDIAPALNGALDGIATLLAGAETGRLYRDGARLVLVGPPNAGKSSLLNRLLREDRAIVTSVAGTTRDTLEETASIGGIPIVLTDTAGLSESPEPIESLGIERARRAAASADAILVVLDPSVPHPKGIDELLARAGDQPLVVALNKIDLDAVVTPSNLPVPAFEISATRGDGIRHLEAALASLLKGSDAGGRESIVIANARHAEALRRAGDHVGAALDAVNGGMPEDFISIDLRGALDALGQITGETASEDLLDTIFRRFCIGK
ncbi:MAG: tRNA uridine-5-carboxymethylaminomethyl(34) synthesis GTPase MnmE [Dehalococcoidia bacterium]